MECSVICPESELIRNSKICVQNKPWRHPRIWCQMCRQAWPEILPDDTTLWVSRMTAVRTRVTTIPVAASLCTFSMHWRPATFCQPRKQLLIHLIEHIP